MHVAMWEGPDGAGTVGNVSSGAISRRLLAHTDMLGVGLLRTASLSGWLTGPYEHVFRGHHDDFARAIIVDQAIVGCKCLASRRTLA